MVRRRERFASRRPSFEDYDPNMLKRPDRLRSSMRRSLIDEEAEAQDYVYQKLQAGFHPDAIASVITGLLASPHGNKERCRKVLSTLSHLRRSGAFGGLPSLAVFDTMYRLPPRSRIVQSIMRERFLDRDLRGGRMSLTVQSQMAQLRALDREAEERLRYERERERDRREECYLTQIEMLQEQVAELRNGFDYADADARSDDSSRGRHGPYPERVRPSFNRVIRPEDSVSSIDSYVSSGNNRRSRELERHLPRERLRHYGVEKRGLRR